MITRCHICGYKSLDDVEINLKPLTVLFGPNASGKSNFLDALQLISNLSTAKSLKEAFVPPYRGKPLESYTFGSRGIEEMLERDSATMTFEVDVYLSDVVINFVNSNIREIKLGIKDNLDADHKIKNYVTERNIRYKISIDINPKTGFLRVSDEYIAALNSSGEPTGKRLPFLSKTGNKLHLRLEGQAHPRGYEIGLDHTVLSDPLYAPHYPHITALKLELSRWFFYYFEPREHMRATNSVKEVRHIGMMGQELAAFLNTLIATRPKQFKAIEKSIHMIIPSINSIKVEPNKYGEVELNLIEGEKSIPARIVSEGTLRVLGLLALRGVIEPPNVIGFEEPENGIHPRRIQHVAELIKNIAKDGTQIIVTSHSNIFLDMIPDESLYVCAKKYGNTTISPIATYGPLTKYNDINIKLNTEEVESNTSSRVMRGDFDA